MPDVLIRELSADAVQQIDAELARLTVLHVDKDFDLIAAVTGQSVETLDIR